MEILPSTLSMSGLNRVSQIMVTLIFALTLSLLTFAACLADAPRSEFMPEIAGQP